ncbi:hypothetical protein [Nostoc sp.]|uniref:hypothetical protein n=1 Tax=Nostoc sp. TaxID=1180 RepID=UPI002FF60D17
MRLLISNPSILITLQRVGFLEPLFNLAIEVNVTDFLYERELKDYDGQKLLKLGLQIQSLEPEMATFAIQYCRSHTTLCQDEGYAFALAQKCEFILLIINPELARLAAIERIKHYSLSLLLELMLDRQVISQDFLQQGLFNITAMTRCHLLRKEAEDCLSKII